MVFLCFLALFVYRSVYYTVFLFLLSHCRCLPPSFIAQICMRTHHLDSDDSLDEQILLNQSNARSMNSITGIPNLLQRAQKSPPFPSTWKCWYITEKLGSVTHFVSLPSNLLRVHNRLLLRENTNREHRNVIGNHWSHEIMSNPFIPQLSLHINQYKDSTGQLFKKISHNILHQKIPPCHWAALQSRTLTARCKEHTTFPSRCVSLGRCIKFGDSATLLRTTS